MTLERDSAGDPFFSGTGQGVIEGNGQLETFNAGPAIADAAGLELVAATVRGFFGLPGTPSAGGFLATEVDGSQVLVASCDAACAASNTPTEFVRPLTQSEINLGLLDGSNTLAISFQATNVSSNIPIIIDELQLVLEFHDTSTVIPLPATGALLLGGLAALGLARRRVGVDADANA
ncbi:MAG: hypothetical protein AAF577_05470 [Pseudomonadota bacterium]